MTGPEHYRTAEDLIRDRHVLEGEGPDQAAVGILALTHATLALAAAFACARLGEMPVWDADAWQDLAGTQPEVGVPS